MYGSGNIGSGARGDQGRDFADEKEIFLCNGAGNRMGGCECCAGLDEVGCGVASMKSQFECAANSKCRDTNQGQGHKDGGEKCEGGERKGKRTRQAYRSKRPSKPVSNE